ncbi:MAG TPA: hypothetical protein PLY48_01880 [Candidatus Cloacimonas acidaminovorans]|jgi:hypothetical protein|nr:hypothetical protein [Candidatus Cloacimonas sp.]HPI43563.1 hypothetical protein [Candidatus Cloacimonas acidaminovorans]HPX57657.1 hypothetical protein [Candidatus Cloacimonas acidaminovorans]
MTNLQFIRRRKPLAKFLFYQLNIVFSVPWKAPILKDKLMLGRTSVNSRERYIIVLVNKEFSAIYFRSLKLRIIQA